MTIVRANCRDRLQGKDVDFIVAVLGRAARERNVLLDLLTDSEARDLVLDDRRLIEAIQDRPAWLNVSSHLYFYLLVRHCLREQGLDDRDVADYVAGLLAEFACADRVTRPLADDSIVMDRMVDLIAALPHQNSEGRFRIRMHIANYALFLTGIFPDRIEQRRRRRGLPGLAYYEDLGRASFYRASRQNLAGEYELRDVFECLSHWFGGVRVALNALTERYLALGRDFGNPVPAQ